MTKKKKKKVKWLNMEQREQTCGCQGGVMWERGGLGRCKLLYIGKINSKILLWASLVVQMVKNPPAVQETSVQSLGCKDPLEKEMATDSSILAWESPWMGEPGGPWSMGSQKGRTGLSDQGCTHTQPCLLCFLTSNIIAKHISSL